MAKDLTKIVDFLTRIPNRDLLDLFLSSNHDSCTVASHPPLGKSDHMVVSVDVKFVVKSTNEDPYHGHYSILTGRHFCNSYERRATSRN